MRKIVEELQHKGFDSAFIHDFMTIHCLGLEVFHPDTKDSQLSRRTKSYEEAAIHLDFLIPKTKIA